MWKTGRTRRVIWKWLAAGALVVVLSACHASDSTDGTAVPRLPTRTLLPPTPTVAVSLVTPTPVPTDLPDPAALMAQTTPVESGGSAGELPLAALAQIDRATADWAAEVDAAPAEIHLVSLEAFLWQDATWGCAAALQTDEAAPPDPVSGYRIVLEYDDQVAVYHTDDGSGIVQCADPTWLAHEGRPITVDPIAESIVAQAQADAGRRSGLPAEQVKIVSVLAVNWPDSSLGCPKPGIEYDPVTTRGYRLVFETDAARLIYHTSIQSVMLCTLEEEILPGALRQALPSATAEPTPGA